MWLASAQFKNLELNIRHSGRFGDLGGSSGIFRGSFRDLGEAGKVYVQMPDHSNRLVEARKVGDDLGTCHFFSSETWEKISFKMIKPGKITWTNNQIL